MRQSKFVSLVLRHDPDRGGITLDPTGWADIDQLIAGARRAGVPMTRRTLEDVVAGNEKQRFEFDDDHRRIRARQGHSVDVDLQLPPAVPPEVLYHGTADRFVASILAEGLRPGTRRHVHLSADDTTAKAVGARHGRPVVLVVRAGDLHRSGHVFHLSTNGVWLTDAVPPVYVSRP